MRTLSACFLALALAAVGCAAPAEEEEMGATESSITRVEGSVGKLSLTVHVAQADEPAIVNVRVACGGVETTTLEGKTDVDGEIQFTLVKPRSCTITIRSANKAATPILVLTSEGKAAAGDELTDNADGYTAIARFEAPSGK